MSTLTGYGAQVVTRSRPSPKEQLRVKIFLVGGIACHHSQWYQLIAELDENGFEHEVVCHHRQTLAETNRRLAERVMIASRGDKQPIVVCHSAGALTLEGLDLSTWVIAINPSYPRGVRVPIASMVRMMRPIYLWSFLTGKQVELDYRDRSFLSDGSSPVFDTDCARAAFAIGMRRVGPLNRFLRSAIIQANDDGTIPEPDRRKIAQFHYLEPVKVSGGHFCHLNQNNVAGNRPSTLVSTIIIHRFLEAWMNQYSRK